MSTPGLSRSRLERMHDGLSGYVSRKDVPGLVALVSHNDDVHVETLGTLSFDTVRDVMTFTMGFGSILAAPDTYPIQKAIREYRIGGDGPMLPTNSPSAGDWLQKLGSLPLMAQPGERWMYQVSADVLGVLIARVSGQSLGSFMRDRIFDPLGMKDTSFFVTPDKVDRLPGFYFFNRTTNALEFFDDPAKSSWSVDLQFESGGGGLVSTIDDYFAFCRMLLNKGKLGNERILSRASIELMMSDQITADQRIGADLFFGTHSSWGFGGSVDISREEIFHNPGRFGWTGGFGTTAYTDPREGVVGILFTQRMMDSPIAPKIFTDFWTLAYESIE